MSDTIFEANLCAGEIVEKHGQPPGRDLNQEHLSRSVYCSTATSGLYHNFRLCLLHLLFRRLRWAGHVDWEEIDAYRISVFDIGRQGRWHNTNIWGGG